MALTTAQVAVHESPNTAVEYVKVEGKIFQLELHTAPGNSCGVPGTKDIEKSFINDIVENLRPILQKRVQNSIFSRKRTVLKNKDATKPVLVQGDNVRLAYSFKARQTQQHCLLSSKGSYRGYTFFAEKVVVHACRMKRSGSEPLEKLDHGGEEQASSSYFGALNKKPGTPLLALRNIVKKSGPKLSKSKKRKKGEDVHCREVASSSTASNYDEYKAERAASHYERVEHINPETIGKTVKRSKLEQTETSTSVLNQECSKLQGATQDVKYKPIYKGDYERSIESGNESYATTEPGSLKITSSDRCPQTGTEMIMGPKALLRINGQHFLSYCSDTDDRMSASERNDQGLSSHLLDIQTNDSSLYACGDMETKNDIQCNAGDLEKSPEQSRILKKNKIVDVHNFCDETKQNQGIPSRLKNKIGELGTSCDEKVEKTGKRIRIPRTSNMSKKSSIYNFSSDSDLDEPHPILKRPSKSKALRIKNFNSSDDSVKSERKEPKPVFSQSDQSLYDVYDFDLEPDPELSTIFEEKRKESEKRRRLRQNVSKFQSMEEDFDELVDARQLYDTSYRASRPSDVLPSASFVMHESMLNEGEINDRFYKALTSVDKLPRGSSSSDEDPSVNLPRNSSDIGMCDKTLGSNPKTKNLKRTKQTFEAGGKKNALKSTRRKSKWKQLLLEWDENQDDFNHTLEKVGLQSGSQNRNTEIRENAGVGDDEVLPVFDPVEHSLGNSKESDNELDTRCGRSLPQSDQGLQKSTNPIDAEISSVASVERLSSKQLIYLVRKHQRDLLHIFQGKIYSRRHQDYKSGGKKRHSLKYQVPMGCFDDEQHDDIMDTLVAIFCRKHQQYLDYVLKVMLPEALILVYMDVHNTDAASAEAAMTPETLQISMSDFLE